MSFSTVVILTISFIRSLKLNDAHTQYFVITRIRIANKMMTIIIVMSSVDVDSKLQIRKKDSGTFINMTILTQTLLTPITITRITYLNELLSPDLHRYSNYSI